MRNPDRLDSFYNELKNIHKNQFPDWRFGQLILNFLSWHYNIFKTDGFYIEEKEFLNRFNQYVEDLKRFKRI